MWVIRSRSIRSSASEALHAPDGNTVHVCRSMVAAIFVMNAMWASGTPESVRPDGRGSISDSMRAMASREDSR
jgi:hypothetical protein